MRRLLALTAGCVALVTAVPALAATQLPKLFAQQLLAIHKAAHAPVVLLPGSMPLDTTHYYASGGPSGSGYALAIGAVRNCGGANACFVAEFSATKSRSVFGKRVTVHGASKAGFFPLSCGASCSPPQIDFVVHGFRYVIQARLKHRAGQTDRSELIAAAEAAIAAGPR